MALANKEEDRILHILISRQEYDLKDIKLSFKTLNQRMKLEDCLDFETETFKASELLQKIVKEYHQVWGIDRKSYIRMHMYEEKR